MKPPPLIFSNLPLLSHYPRGKICVPLYVSPKCKKYCHHGTIYFVQASNGLPSSQSSTVPLSSPPLENPIPSSSSSAAAANPNNNNIAVSNSGNINNSAISSSAAVAAAAAAAAAVASGAPHSQTIVMPPLVSRSSYLPPPIPQS